MNPNLLPGVLAQGEEKDQERKWRCCAQGTEGHRAAGNLVSNDHIHTEQSGEGIVAECARQITAWTRLVKREQSILRKGQNGHFQVVVHG